MLGLEFENEFKVDELDVKVTIVVVEKFLDFSLSKKKKIDGI